jgi:hypothetical protein
MEFTRQERVRTLSQGNPGSNNAAYYCGAKFDTIPTLSILPQPPVHWKSTQSKSTPSSPIPTLNAAAGSTIKSGFEAGNSVSVFKSTSLPIASNNHLNVLLKTKSSQQFSNRSQAGGNFFNVKRAKRQIGQNRASVQGRKNIDMQKKSAKVASEDNAAPASANIKEVNGHALMKMLKLHHEKYKLCDNSNDSLDSTSVTAFANSEFPYNLSAKPAVQKSPRPCHLYQSGHQEYKDISEHLKSLLKVCN